MTAEELKQEIPETEFIFSASRSSGPGGQNINKVSTKIELRIQPYLTESFYDAEKVSSSINLKNKINNEGELILVSQSERTQLMNKEDVIEKFYDLVSKALTLPRVRKTNQAYVIIKDQKA